jgi:hypothetical protein
MSVEGCDREEESQTAESRRTGLHRNGWTFRLSLPH